MLARSQIEILGDTEKILAERVVEGARAVHPSESRASRRPGRAFGWGAKHVEKRWEVGVKLEGSAPQWGRFVEGTNP